MTATVTIEMEKSVVDAVNEALEAMREGMAQAEDADRFGWQRSVIDTAIRALAETGRDFSANDVRLLIPDDITGPLMGARFNAAQTQKVIRWRHLTRSTKKSTHGHRISVWRGMRPTDD